jgi:hypothetical protein
MTTRLMTDLLFLDIETAPNPAMEPYIPEPEASSNYKDSAKIAVYVAEKRQAAIERMALDVDFAQIKAIGLAIGLDAEPEVWINHHVDGERDDLVRLWAMIAPPSPAPLPCICGYNALGFDMPIIIRRSFALGVQPGRVLDLRRYGTCDVLDLMQVFYHWGQAPGVQARGLKAAARMFGIPNPLPDLDGSKVSTMDDDTLRAYCANDVRMTQELARRMQGVYF